MTDGKAALFELLSLLREAEALMDQVESDATMDRNLSEIRSQKARISARIAAIA